MQTITTYDCRTGLKLDAQFSSATNIEYLNDEEEEDVVDGGDD